MKLPRVSVGRLIVVGLAVCAISLIVFFMTPRVMPKWVTEWRIPLWFAHFWPLGLPLGWLAVTGLLYRLGWIKDVQMMTHDSYHPELSHQQWKRLNDASAGWEPFRH